MRADQLAADQAAPLGRFRGNVPRNCARRFRGNAGEQCYAVFCQGPYPESARYRDFMGWDMSWYSAQPSISTLLSPPRRPGMMHLVCYLRDGDRAFETYWTTLRGVEQMDNSYALMDLTVYGRQESWEDSPPGWPQECTNTRTDGGPPAWPPVPEWPAGRPISQWPRLEAGHSDDLTAGP